MDKKIFFKLEIGHILKDLNQKYQSQILIPQIEDINEDCVKIECSCLLYFPRNMPSKSVPVGPIHRFK